MRPAAERLRRVILMVPHILAHGGASIPELARTFDVPEREVVRDLEVLWLCGLPPYTPDQLVEVDIDGDFVTIREAEWFRRPLRLTPGEGLALLTSGRALLALPGSDPQGPLATALEKLEALLGARGVVDVEIEAGVGVERFREAATRRERLEVDYYSFGRDALTTRRVDPHAVVNLDGHWYVAAHCHLAGDERLFRLDRIRAVRETGERFDPPPPGGPPEDAFRPSPGEVRATLDLPARAHWVAESYPVEEVRERRGRLRVTLAIGAPAFLERILLRAGPGTEVVRPKQWADLGARAARRVLARYGRG